MSGEKLEYKESAPKERNPTDSSRGAKKDEKGAEMNSSKEVQKPEGAKTNNGAETKGGAETNESADLVQKSPSLKSAPKVQKTNGAKTKIPKSERTKIALSKSYKNLHQKNGIPPTQAEVQKKTNMSIRTVKNYWEEISR